MLVVGDVVHNEIVDLATHVWPCAGQLERSDVAGVMEYYKQEVVGQLAAAVVPPEAERRHVWWCFAQLGARLGLDCLPAGLDVEACDDDDVIDALAGPAASVLRDAPHGIVAERPDAWVTERLLPNGRWRLAPFELCAALSALRSPSPISLIPGRQLRTMNSALRDIAAAGERTDAADIHISRADAERGDISDGDVVTVRSRHGEVSSAVVVDDDLRDGVVWIPHGWLAPNVGLLTSAHDDIDPLTGMVLQSGVEVSIETAP